MSDENKIPPARRRVLYDTRQHPALARSAARAGLARKEIARQLGISPRTLAAWEKEHPELAEALRQGRDLADHLVADSLHRLATGYDYDEAQVVRTPKGDRVTKVKKHRSGSVVACIFWLKNRAPQQWRDKVAAAESEEKVIRFRPVALKKA